MNRRQTTSTSNTVEESSILDDVLMRTREVAEEAKNIVDGILGEVIAATEKLDGIPEHCRTCSGLYGCKL